MRCLLLFALLIAGCRGSGPPLPTYPATSPAASVEVIRQRAAGLANATGGGTVTLTQPRRGTVRLDAAFALAQPETARVQLWKFAVKVFDLTVRPDGAWLFVPRVAGGSDGRVARGATDAPRVMRGWLRYLQGDLTLDGATSVVEDGATITVTRPADFGGATPAPGAGPGATVTSVVDRRTLTITAHVLRDGEGRERLRLALENYRYFGDTIWPARITGTSAAGGRVVVETRELEMGTQPDAFKPPKRATKLP